MKNRHNDSDLSKSQKHFWVASSPFFQTLLYIAPNDWNATQHRAHITIYDADGVVINEVDIETPTNRVTILELNHLLARCKLESGLAHAHVKITPVNNAATYYSKVVGPNNTIFMRECITVDSSEQAFLPVSLSSEKNTTLAIVNYSSESAQLRTRLFVSGRLPEIVTVIPPFGSRIVRLENEFAECTSNVMERVIPGYLRFATKNETGLGVQVLEESRSTTDARVYQAVA